MGSPDFYASIKNMPADDSQSNARLLAFLAILTLAFAALAAGAGSNAMLLLACGMGAKAEVCMMWYRVNCKH